jgi:hypothetical protein
MSCKYCLEDLSAPCKQCGGVMADEFKALQDKLDTAQKDLETSELMLGIWRDAEAKRREGDHFEVRLDTDGAIDEIVGSGAFHIEQMDTNSWFMEVGGCAFNVHGKAVKLTPRDYDNWQEAKKAGEAPKP